MTDYARPAAIWAAGAVAALFLAWISLPLPLAAINPFLAETIAPPSGTVKEAKAGLLLMVPGSTPAEVVAIDRAALHDEPMAFDAASNLGLIYYLTGKRDVALNLFQLVGRANLRNKDSHAMLLQHALDTNDGNAAVREAEILLRQRQSLEATALKVLTVMVDRGSVTNALADRLAQDVPWRAQLLGAIGENGTNPERELALFRAMKARGRGPTGLELDSWLFKQSATLPPQSVAAFWREFGGAALPAERFVRAGNMDVSAAPRPFNWTFYTGDDGFAEREKGPSGSGNAMLAEFRGGDGLSLARQWLALDAGRYRFSARILAPSEVIDASLFISISCVGADHPLATVPLVAAKADAWMTVRADFAVRPGCPVQALTVDGRGSPDDGYQQMFIDDFAIQPVAAGAINQTVG